VLRLLEALCLILDSDIGHVDAFVSVSSFGAGNFYLHHCIQTGSGAYPTSYLMGARGSFPGDKVTRGVKLTTDLYLVPRS
jgi:hypothetical protein